MEDRKPIIIKEWKEAAIKKFQNIKATSRKPTSTRTFNTWGEALSFSEGVSFANDSALDVIVDFAAEVPTINIFDSDAETEED